MKSSTRLCSSNAVSILVVVYVALDETWFFNLICYNYFRAFFLSFFFNVERGEKRTSCGGQGVLFKAHTNSENHGP